jgi:hypothetical protein
MACTVAARGECATTVTAAATATATSAATLVNFAAPLLLHAIDQSVTYDDTWLHTSSVLGSTGMLDSMPAADGSVSVGV